MTTPTRHRRDTARDAALTALAAATAGQLTEAWHTLAAAQQAVIQALRDTPPRPRTVPKAVKAALAALVTATAAFDRAAMAIAERWAAVDLPTAYRDGAQQALRRAQASASLFQWTASHQGAVTAITAGAYADLVGRIREAVRRAQALGRDATAAAQSFDGPDPDALAATYPGDVIIYGNDARHPVSAWALAALIAQATWAANTGSLRAAMDELGCEWMEIADGPECGWETHDSFDHAAGTIRSVDSCAAYPIAHPGCRREMIPRPDLTGRTDIQDGQAA